jgi:hypothetical protein
MNSKDFQFASYTPAEFEQFRTAVQQDGFQITQNTIDTVSGHIGSLTYITGKYNRNQQILTVTVKTSPWGSTQDADLKTNVLRVVNKSAASDVVVNHEAVKTTKTAAGTPVAPKSIAAGPVKNAAVPPALTTAQATNIAAVLKQGAIANAPAANITPTLNLPKQQPVPASTPAVPPATSTPTK